MKETTFIVNYSKGDVVLLPYPFTDLSAQKVRPAIIVGSTKKKQTDVFIVPLTSRTDNLREGEFVLKDWQKAGLNVATAVKKGCILINTELVLCKVGVLDRKDLKQVEDSLRFWLDL